MKWIALLAISLLSFLVFACNQTSSNSGAQLYKDNCANCHMENGQGIGTLIPDITNRELFKDDPYAIACKIRVGIKANSESQSLFETYAMPPQPTLSETELTNILNYMRERWYTNQKPVQVNIVKERLNACN